MVRVAILGTGRLGSALGRDLAARGISVTAVWNRTAARARRCAPPGARVFREPVQAARSADVVLLAVADRALPALAARLRRGPWAGRVVLHTAGLLGPQVLAPLARGGAATGSLHPLQSVTGAPPLWRGVRWAFAGHPLARRAAETLVAALGGRLLERPPTDRALYHGAATLLATGVTALAGEAHELLVRAGLSPEEAWRALRPFLKGVARNLDAAAEPGAALTGPLARGDLATVRVHGRALRAGAPEAWVLYRELGRRVLKKVRLGAAVRRRLAALLRRSP